MVPLDYTTLSGTHSLTLGNYIILATFCLQQATNDESNDLNTAGVLPLCSFILRNFPGLDSLTLKELQHNIFLPSST